MEESSNLVTRGVPASPGIKDRDTPGNRCRRCGGESHSIQQCPARDVICLKCNRKGHFRKHCLSKTVAAVTGDLAQLEVQEIEEEPDFYLDTASDDGAEKLWKIEVIVNNTNKVQFKVDTGAEVTAMSVSAWKSLVQIPKLHTTKRVLGGPDSKPLSVVGVALLLLSFKGKTCNQRVYILENLKNNLLGLPAIQALEI